MILVQMRSNQTGSLSCTTRVLYTRLFMYKSGFTFYSLFFLSSCKIIKEEAFSQIFPENFRLKGHVKLLSKDPSDMGRPETNFT